MNALLTVLSKVFSTPTDIVANQLLHNDYGFAGYIIDDAFLDPYYKHTGENVFWEKHFAGVRLITYTKLISYKETHNGMNIQLANLIPRGTAHYTIAGVIDIVKHSMITIRLKQYT